MSDVEMAIDGMSSDTLPSGWAAAPLSDLATNRSGNSKLIKGKLSSEETKSSPYPGFSASGQDVWLSSYDHVGKAIIISAVGARCGKAFEADGKWTAIANTHIVRPNEIVLDAKLFWYLINDEKFWVRGGSAQPFVKVNKTFERIFPLAPLAEQKRIADKLEAVLGRVDACRARLDRVPALLKRFRQSVLAAATSGKLTKEWRMTNGVNNKLDNIDIEFEDAPLTLPSSWKVTRADTVCSSVRDGTHDTPKYVKSGIPLVTSKNIRPAGIDFEGAQQISQDDHREISKRSKVDVGDVLFSMIGSVGHICIVETGREFSIKNVGLFKNNPGTVLPRYMFYWLQGPFFTQWLEPRLRGGNQKFASLGLLRESPIFLPTLPEQQEIVRRVEALFAFADRIEARLATAQKTIERLTPATLAKAFRGELVPQDPNDEPASALLDQLRATAGQTTQKPKRKLAKK